MFATTSEHFVPTPKQRFTVISMPTIRYIHIKEPASIHLSLQELRHSGLNTPHENSRLFIDILAL